MTKGHRIEYLGIEDVDGTPAIKLRVTRKDGDLQYVYLDPDSALEIRIRTVRKVRGTEQIDETDLGEYQQVAGVWLPFSLETGEPGGPADVPHRIERAEPNVAVDPAWFRVPTSFATRAVAAGPADKAGASPAAPPPPTKPAVIDGGTISGLGARNIGSAAMSGRIAAVAAVNVKGQTTSSSARPRVACGSRSTAARRSSRCSTSRPVQSIGAIAIDPSNPKIVWVGTGEAWTRNSVSIGDGIYRSTDGGETWTNMGLRESERIARSSSTRATATSCTHACPASCGATARTAACTRQAMAARPGHSCCRARTCRPAARASRSIPKNPDVLLAGMWDFRRKGWTFRSGGDGPNAPSGSGMFRSTDGGRTWRRSRRRRACRRGRGAASRSRYAPSDREIVYALIESKRHRAVSLDDGGATWEQRDKSQKMVWRPFYFARLVVDPTNPDRLFKPDLSLIVSEDGGKSFADTGGGSHGDWHDLWIDPQNPKHVIGGDDGGLWLSCDGGNRWLKENNLPVSQFYHVSLDDKDPYQVYGGLQDNSSWVGDSAYPGGITNSRWKNVCNGDGFWSYVDPTDPSTSTARARAGTSAASIARPWRRAISSRRPGYKEKLRFNWNTPIAASPTQKGTLYIGAQFLFRSRDRGDTWQRISPDLDDERSREAEAGAVGRRHRRQLVGRDAHDDLFDQRVAEERERDLGRHRRRQPPAHARRRQVVDERRRERARPAEELVGQLGRGEPVRSGDRVRDVRSPHVRRHDAVGLQDDRLRQDLEAISARSRRSRLRAHDQGRHGQAEPPVPRHRIRALDLGRRRRDVGAVRGQRLPAASRCARSRSNRATATS